MTKLLRVLGKRGRITIPYEIRQRVGFSCNDVLSFTESADGRTVTVRREKICDNCKNEKPKPLQKDDEVTLLDFLNDLSDEQQRAALIHLSAAGQRKQMVIPMADKYVYPYSSVEAKRLGELDEWRTSHKANMKCAAAIDKAVRDGFDGMHLPGDIAENACREFGIDRVRWVLANTVQHADWDARYRPHNKEWAAKTYIPRNAQNDNTTDFVLGSHPELVNGLVDQYRRFYDNLQLFDSSHCMEGSRDLDYQGKVLVLDSSILKDENKTPHDQLFYANIGGFGCTPGNHGKVMGTFLSDDEETNFHRDDFLGIIDDKYLPDWAKEKLEELSSQTEDEDSGMTMQ